MHIKRLETTTNKKSLLIIESKTKRKKNISNTQANEHTIPNTKATQNTQMR